MVGSSTETTVMSMGWESCRDMIGRTIAQAPLCIIRFQARVVGRASSNRRHRESKRIELRNSSALSLSLSLSDDIHRSEAEQAKLFGCRESPPLLTS